jgi:hypothetical protein
MDGLTESGIQFYDATFHLNIDSDLDAPLGIELSAPERTIVRVIDLGQWVSPHSCILIGLFPTTPALLEKSLLLILLQATNTVNTFHTLALKPASLPPGVINNRGFNTPALNQWA